MTRLEATPRVVRDAEALRDAIPASRTIELTAAEWLIQKALIAAFEQGGRRILSPQVCNRCVRENSDNQTNPSVALAGLEKKGALEADVSKPRNRMRLPALKDTRYVVDGVRVYPDSGMSDSPPEVSDQPAGEAIENAPARKPVEYPSAGAVAVLERLDRTFGLSASFGGGSALVVFPDMKGSTFYSRLRQLVETGAVRQVAGTKRAPKDPPQYQLTGLAATTKDGVTYQPASVDAPSLTVTDSAAPEPAPAPTRIVKSKSQLEEEARAIESQVASAVDARTRWERSLEADRAALRELEARIAALEANPPRGTEALDAKLARLRRLLEYYDDMVVDASDQG